MNRRRIFVFVAALVVMAAAIAGIIYVYSQSRKALVESAERDLAVTADRAAKAADGFFGPAALIVDQIQVANLTALEPDTQERVFFSLASYAIQALPQVDSVYIGRTDGSFFQLTDLVYDKLIASGEITRDYGDLVRRVVRRSQATPSDTWFYQNQSTREWDASKLPPNPAGYDPRERPWYKAAVTRDGPGWGMPYPFASSSDLGITLSSPIKDAQGKLWGVIGVDFSLKTLGKLVYSYRLEHLGTQGFMFISDSNGHLIAHSRLTDSSQFMHLQQSVTVEEATSIHNTHLDSGDDLAVFVDMIGRSGSVEHVVNKGRDILGIRLPLDEKLHSPEFVYIGQVQDAVIGGAISELRRNLAILAGLMAVLGTIAFYAVKLRGEIATRRRTEIALHQSHAGLARAQRMGHIGSAEVDLIKDEAIWSEEQFRLYGLDPALNVPNMDRIYDMIHPDDQEIMRESRRRNERGEATEPIEYRIVRPDGEIRWIHREVEMLHDSDGRPTKFFSTQQDVTERKQGEFALQLAKEIAEDATKAKSSFLAMMSHEIRTPMNGVMSMAEMLDQTDLTDDQRSMSSVIRSSASALLTIINDILDFSKIEAGKLDIENVPFSLVETVEGAGELVGGRAEEHGIDLIIDLDPALPDRLKGDPARLRQVLLNLLGNAVKFTQSGSVTLKVSGSTHAETPLRLRFEVIDTGIGLTDEQRGKLFQPFVQADASTSRKYGGTGLGLSICHRLCVMMGGAIGVDSIPGEGSTFWVELPFQVADPAPERPDVEISDARLLALGFMGPERAALERLIAASGISDVVWDDASVPDLDGRVVLLRAAPSDQGALELAHNLADHNRLILAATRGLASTLGAAAGIGAFATLTLPIRRRRLWQVLAAALGRAELGQRQSGTADTSIGWAPPPIDEARAANALVLVAEDNPTNQIVIRRMLDQRGYAHEIAGNGVAALALLEGGGHGLLLTDFHMPEMDGFQLTAAIREREARAGGHIPIVALTADALPGTEQLCLDAGMDAYLAKPIDSRALTDTLARLLPQAASLRRRAQRATASPAVAKPAAPRISPEILDLERLKEAFGTIDDAALSFLDGFIDDVPRMIGAISDGIAAGDGHRARDVAHALKGAARSAGAIRLGQIASDIQDRLDADDLDTASFLVEALPPTHEELHAALKLLRGNASVVN